MTSSSQRPAQPDEVRKLEQALAFQWRIWSVIVTTELADVQTAADTSDAMATLFGQGSRSDSGTGPREAALNRLLHMFSRDQAPEVRAVVDFAYEVIGARQRAAHEKDTRSRIKEGLQPRARESVNVEVYETIHEELRGTHDPKASGRAGLVFWRRENPQIALQPTTWVAIPRQETSVDDFQHPRTAVRRPNRTKGLLVLGGLAGALLLGLYVLISSLTGSAASAPGAGMLIMNGTPQPSWQQTSPISLTWGTGHSSATTIPPSIPLSLCVSGSKTLLADLRATTTLTVTVDAAQRVYQQQDAAPYPDLRVRTCGEKGVAVWQGMLRDVQLEQPLDRDRLVAIYAWAADVLPAEIAPASMRVDVVWTTDAYQTAQLMLPNGQRLSPASSATSGEETRVSYVIPLVEYALDVGLILEQADGLPLRTTITVPAPTHRTAWLEKRFSVDVTHPAWGRDGTLDLTLTLTPVAQERTLIPLDLQPSDLTARHGRRDLAVQWQPPTAITETVTTTVRIAGVADGERLEIALGRHMYTLTSTP